MRLYRHHPTCLPVILFLIFFGVFFGYTSAVSAATFTVSKTVDTADGTCDTDCSLREAVIAANANGEDDTITLPSGTYTLSIAGQDENAAATGDLDITSSMTLSGAGAQTTTIDGNGIDRVFHLHTAGTSTMSDVTITGGNLADCGGGVMTVGVTVTLQRTIIEDNTTINCAGGVGNDSAILTIDQSLIRNNTAFSRGGGVSNESGGSSLFTIINTTITENIATNNYGGGIDNESTMVIRHSTITGNTAGEDGDNLFTDHSLTVSNTIIDGGCSGGMDSLGYNVDTGTSCGFNQSTDQNSTDPQFDTVGLQDHGGSTFTIALDQDSPAIDAIPSSSCTDQNGDPLTEDQRGWSRPDNSACDVGAYEADNTNPSISVTTNTAEVNTVECAVDTFTDPGATATDNEDSFFGTTTAVQTSGSVDTTIPDTYTITYTATDSVGNTGTETRQVVVEDTTVSELVLVGDAEMEVEQGSEFTDPGVILTDVCNPSAIVTVDNPVQTDIAGVYTITYTANDGYTTNSVTRTVTVVAEAPVEEEEEISVMTDVVQNDDGTVTIFYDDESSQTITPFGGKNNFIFVLSADATRLIVSNGKLVRVFVNGAQIVQKRVQQKKPDQYKLRVVKFFSAYHSVIIATQRNQRLQLTVMRLTAQNALKKKEQKRIQLHEQQTAQDMKLRIKKKKKRIIVIFGEDRFMYKLKKNGQLIRL